MENHWLIPIISFLVVVVGLFALAIIAPLFIELFDWIWEKLGNDRD